MEEHWLWVCGTSELLFPTSILNAPKMMSSWRFFFCAWTFSCSCSCITPPRWRDNDCGFVAHLNFVFNPNNAPRMTFRCIYLQLFPTSMMHRGWRRPDASVHLGSVFLGKLSWWRCTLSLKPFACSSSWMLFLRMHFLWRYFMHL